MKFIYVVTVALLTSAFIYKTPETITQEPVKGFDTCYYFLSGRGLAPIGPTILKIMTIDCKCSIDSIDILLNNNLKETYPDDFFMLENRKVNGPYKKLSEAENEILRLKNIKSTHN